MATSTRRTSTKKMKEAAAVKAGIERAKLEKLIRQQQTTTTSEEGPGVASGGYQPLSSWQNTRLVPPDVLSHLLHIIAIAGLLFALTRGWFLPMCKALSPLTF